MFGDEFFTNTVVCFTRFSQEKRARTRRSKKEADYIKEY